MSLLILFKRRSAVAPLFTSSLVRFLSDMSWQSAQDSEAQRSCVKEALIAGAKAAFLSSLAASAALGLANHFSPSFKAALGPSGRAAMVALPALGVVFLEVEWKINACAMRQRYADKPTAVEPNDILPKRSG